LILLTLLNAIFDTILTTVFSFIIAYIFLILAYIYVQLVPLPEMVSIMAYEKNLLNRPRTNKR